MGATRPADAAYAESQKGVPQPRHPLKLVESLLSRTGITLLDAAPVPQAWQMLAERLPTLDSHALM